MKYLLFLFGMSLTLVSFAYDSGVLSLGATHVCALETQGVQCWGSNNFGEINVPQLNNPRQVSAGGSHTCALDDEGVKCWGSNISGEINVPQLDNPRQVSAGASHTCALDDDGVKCWGSNNFGEINVPQLNNPRQVSAGGRHTCALDDVGIKCWGRNNSREINVPQLNNPRQVSTGGAHTCALDDDGVKCWGYNKFGQTNVPHLVNVTSISAAGYQTCALDDKGVKCWGDNTNGETTVPYLNKPRIVSAGANHACALDDDGVKCWGSNKHGQLEVVPDLEFGPSSTAPVFSLKEVSLFLNIAYLGSSPIKAKVLKALKEYSENELLEGNFSTFFKRAELAAARYTLAALIESVIKSADSGYYLEKVIPAYKVSIENIHGELGIRGLDDIFDLKAVREVALKVIQVNLNVASEFLTISERKDLQETNRLLGAAMADANNRDKVFKALDSVDNCKRILSKLENSSKTAFVFNTLYSASEFLERKIR